LMSIFGDRPALLLSFRQGDRAALEAVYRGCVRSVERYLRALARRSGAHDFDQPSAIADLLQEVFIRAFSAAGRKGYDGVRDYMPYLMTIARNCFVDYQRARGREVPTDAEQLSMAVDDRASVDSGWCEPKAAAVIAAFIRDLAPHLKGVYEQRFVLGRSQAVASSELGLSRRALRTGENQLRMGLRKALARAGISLLEIRGYGEDFPNRISASPVSRKVEP